MASDPSTPSTRTLKEADMLDPSTHPFRQLRHAGHWTSTACATCGQTEDKHTALVAVSSREIVAPPETKEEDQGSRSDQSGESSADLRGDRGVTQAKSELMSTVDALVAHAKSRGESAVVVLPDDYIEEIDALILAATAHGRAETLATRPEWATRRLEVLHAQYSLDANDSELGSFRQSEALTFATALEYVLKTTPATSREEASTQGHAATPSASAAQKENSQSADFLAQREAAQGWQLIETAPKDMVWSNHHNQYGSWVLVADSGDVLTARWWQRDDEADAHNWITVGGNAINPTHWQPLPPAPSAPEEKTA